MAIRDTGNGAGSPPPRPTARSPWRAPTSGSSSPGRPAGTTGAERLDGHHANTFVHRVVVETLFGTG